MPQITAAGLDPAKQKMIECGLSSEQATREIGFALFLVNASIGDTKNGDMTKDLDKIITAVQMAIYSGLSLNPNKNECTLVAEKRGFGVGCFYMPLYGGLLKVAKVEGSVLGASAQVVYEGDVFKITDGVRTNKVYHEMKSFGKNDKPLVTWCILYLPNDIEQLSILKEHDYQKMRIMGITSIHDKWGDQFRIKSTLKRGLKLTTSEKTSKLNDLIAYDDTHYDLKALEEPAEKTPVIQKAKVTAKAEPLPIMNEMNPNFMGCVKAIKIKTHTFETLRKHFDISERVEKDIIERAKTYILKEAKTEAA